MLMRHLDDKTFTTLVLAKIIQALVADYELSREPNSAVLDRDVRTAYEELGGHIVRVISDHARDAAVASRKPAKVRKPRKAKKS